MDALGALGVALRSPIKDEHYRDEMGGLTHFKSSRRFVYINIPKTPLPKMMKVGANFTAYLYYREQSSSENGGGTNLAQTNEGKGRELVGNNDNSGTAPSDSKQKVDRSATQHDERRRESFNMLSVAVRKTPVQRKDVHVKMLALFALIRVSAWECNNVATTDDGPSLLSNPQEQAKQVNGLNQKHQVQQSTPA
ncbi:hypothetical protein ElyMa_002575700 [Elysia marginata]|uniref:Uncharacterized protein n=1 Tax=Elysia marginata TaxID=1093978 RepID=A0AAV4GXW5_9GAST|nr:hypothetical protein ElyMa_002575700 [Elysia marginata]